MRISFSLHKMCNNKSPVELKDCFISRDNPDSRFNLRSNNQILITIARTYNRFGDLKFKIFVAQTVNKLTRVNLYPKFKIFKNDFLDNINDNY